MAMSIEISGSKNGPTSINPTNKADNNNTNKNVHDSQSTTTKADSFVVSQRAETLRILESSINADSGIDATRIESLKIEIDAGRYNVDSARVAEKLIDFEAQLVA
jgi:negative regulator of flagellin synthesis FlgM